MMTQEEIEQIYDGGETKVTVLENPATLAGDPTLAVIAGRMIKYSGGPLNPYQVKFEDYDCASVSGEDPKNPIDIPYLSYVWRHKKTKRGMVTQNSAAYGYPIPHNIVYEIGELSQKVVVDPE